MLKTLTLKHMELFSWGGGGGGQQTLRATQRLPARSHGSVTTKAPAREASNWSLKTINLCHISKSRSMRHACRAAATESRSGTAALTARASVRKVAALSQKWVSAQEAALLHCAVINTCVKDGFYYVTDWTLAGIVLEKVFLAKGERDGEADQVWKQYFSSRNLEHFPRTESVLRLSFSGNWKRLHWLLSLRKWSVFGTTAASVWNERGRVNGNNSSQGKATACRPNHRNERCHQARTLSFDSGKEEEEEEIHGIDLHQYADMTTMRC